MVIMPNMLEMSAIEAPGFVSPPNAAGKTTVLSPIGSAKELRAGATIYSGKFNHFRTDTNTAGIATSRISEAIYTLLLDTISESLYLPITIPVNNIANTPTHPESPVIVDITNSGTGMLKIPRIIPAPII
jgi:hypothetical protein